MTENELIKHYLPYIKRLAKKYTYNASRFYLDSDDIVNIGLEALIRMSRQDKNQIDTWHLYPSLKNKIIDELRKNSKNQTYRRYRNKVTNDKDLDDICAKNCSWIVEYSDDVNCSNFNQEKDYTKKELFESVIFSGKKKHHKRNKIIFNMYLNGYNQREIADELNLTTGRLSQIMHNFVENGRKFVGIQ